MQYPLDGATITVFVTYSTSFPERFKEHYMKPIIQLTASHNISSKWFTHDDIKFVCPVSNY
jgi:hypothetical protein